MGVNPDFGRQIYNSTRGEYEYYPDVHDFEMSKARERMNRMMADASRNSYSSPSQYAEQERACKIKSLTNEGFSEEAAEKYLKDKKKGTETKESKKKSPISLSLILGITVFICFLVFIVLLKMGLVLATFMTAASILLVCLVRDKVCYQ